MESVIQSEVRKRKINAVYKCIWASQVVLGVKNPPANAGDIEVWFQSLGWEDPLEEEMTTHSSILAWRIPWTEKPGGLQSMGSQSRTQLRDLACMGTLMHIYGI